MSETPTLSAPSLRVRTAEEVRVALARKRVSATQLARMMRVSQAYVWRRLAGETAFDVDDLEAIAEHLGVSVADLLPSDVRGMVRPTPAKVTPPVRPPDNRPKGGASNGLTRTRSVRRPTWKRGLTPDVPLLAAG